MTSVFPPREGLVSDIPARDRNIEKLFLRCRRWVAKLIPSPLASAALWVWYSHLSKLINGWYMKNTTKKNHKCFYFYRDVLSFWNLLSNATIRIRISWIVASRSIIFVLLPMSHCFIFFIKKDYGILALFSLYFSGCCCLSLQETYIFKEMKRLHYNSKSCRVDVFSFHTQYIFFKEAKDNVLLWAIHFNIKIFRRHFLLDQLKHIYWRKMICNI